jgi:cytochrome c biogenesis protein CcmG/thiol:disulfide interchange protein DsbE
MTDDITDAIADELEHDPAPSGSNGHPALATAVTVAVVVGLLVVVLAISKPSTDRQATSPLLGQAAPLVAGTTLDGSRYDLDRHRGRWVIVNFVAEWCTPCRVEHPELKEFAARHASQGDVSIVGVIFDDQPDDVRTLFDTLGGDWPVVLDPEGQIALEYGIAKVPESYLVNPDGVVVGYIRSGVTADGLDELIRRAEAAAS